MQLELARVSVFIYSVFIIIIAMFTIQLYNICCIIVGISRADIHGTTVAVRDKDGCA